MKEQKSVRAHEFLARYVKIYSGVAVLCVLMAVLVAFTVLKLAPASPKLPVPDTTPTSTTTPEASVTPQVTDTKAPETTAPVTTPPINNTKIETFLMSASSSKQGLLVLVKENNPFDTTPILQSLVTIRENPDREFTVDGWTHKLTIDTFHALNLFQNTMEAELNNKNLQFCTTRPFDNTDLTSEHATGTVADLKFYDVSNGKSYSFSAYQVADQYKWVKENAWRFGFIFRYPSEKQSITGNGGEFSHVRYVGTVHAEYMYKNNLCLEEYIDLLKKYNFNSPLTFESADGNSYYLYHVNANPDGDTSVYTRKDTDRETYGQPEISGTNDGGFIVCQEFHKVG